MAIPANPRDFNKLAFATGNAGAYGGSPAEGCMFENKLIYPFGDYTVNTDPPQIRIFDGITDRGMASVPATQGGAVTDAVISMLNADGTVYITTLDTGSSSADWIGRVFNFNPDSGDLTQLGAPSVAGEIPYAMAWHMGRLWIGTNNGIGTAGKIYFFRPGIDTVFTTDHDCGAGVCSMVSYGGNLYVGTDAPAGTFGKVLVRDDTGTYSTSDTGSGGTARVNNGYYSLHEFGGDLYAGYFNNDTPKVAKIRKFHSSSWSTAYTGSGTTLIPYIHMFVDLTFTLYIVGGGLNIQGVLLKTTDGSSFTDLSAQLLGSATCLPLHGIIVL